MASGVGSFRSRRPAPHRCALTPTAVAAPTAIGVPRRVARPYFRSARGRSRVAERPQNCP
ncbi:hypothetical protein ASE41_29375 [Streptomyces sp. Root264]|nr:hypothetical protein ASE41_29375 [Streptomyces sp. Root264]